MAYGRPKAEENDCSGTYIRASGQWFGKFKFKSFCGTAFVIRRGAVDVGIVDNVNKPAHYTAGGIESIEYMRAKMTPEQFEGFLMGNVLIYIYRYSMKKGLDDLE